MGQSTDRRVRRLVVTAARTWSRPSLLKNPLSRPSAAPTTVANTSACLDEAASAGPHIPLSCVRSR